MSAEQPSGSALAHISAEPYIGRLDLNEETVRGWAREARARWRVSVRVFPRSLSCGGLRAMVWVAVVYPREDSK